MRLYITILLFFAVTMGIGQSYNLSQLEASFLKENYLLLAEQYDISKAEAEIVQEKVWNNPNLAISEVNLWTNPGSETMSPLFGRYGQTQQISVELEQLIETAGKRKKRVAIKRTEHRMAVYEFEELIRELKKELRQHFHQLASQTHSHSQMIDVVVLFEQLAEQYERQVDQGNVSKADYNRIRNELLGLRKEQVELETDMASSLSALRVLTRINDLEVAQLQIEESFANRTMLLPKDIASVIREQNIGIKRQSAAIEKAEQLLNLEEAQRKPDVTLQLGYDRGGNIMQDFMGIGVRLDLPFFDRNRGNIQKAKYEVEKEKVLYDALQLETEQTVQRYKKQLLQYETILQQWRGETGPAPDRIMENYRKHLEQQQITLIAFIDYVQSHREANESFWEMWSQYNNAFEELQYLVGKDF